MTNHARLVDDEEQHELPDVDTDTPPDSEPITDAPLIPEPVTVSTIKESLDITGSDVTVEAVDHDKTAAVIETPEEKLKRKKGRDKRRLMLAKEGLSEEQIDRLLPGLMVHTGSQRGLPVYANVLDPEMVEYFADRDTSQVLTDAIKAIRDDGGTRGPTGAYELLMTGCADDHERAVRVAARVKHRIRSIRTAIVATVNELERRRLVSLGQDPTTGRYLAVK